ncbi:MAG: VWA domain-containing protein [Proteobacteria bacterium]|jgi:Ca-activated chloride channel homolog|nr:VWA domain-containing protein [Pseudomonadota bacterium]
MNPCHEHHLTIKNFNPEDTELSTELALHLDECDECRALFDQRFTPWNAEGTNIEERVPEGLAGRAMPETKPQPRRRRWPLYLAFGGVGSVAMAALALITVGTLATTYQAELQMAPMVDDPTMSPISNPVPIALSIEDGTATESDSISGPDRKNNLRVIRGAGVAKDKMGLAGGQKYQELGDYAQGENYTDYGINNFVNTSDDQLSTFAIDVDTASYTMARRKLLQGHLPSPESIRVEEFVNYFPYEYRPPREGEPFGVDFVAAESPWRPGHHLVRVGVQGKKVAFDERKPVHLTFLVDTSGSMQSRDKLELVKTTLKMLTEELEDGDTVAIVAYAGSAGLVLEPTPMSEKDKIQKALRRLAAGGSTAMGAGIELAYHLADQTYSEGAVNRVIVCSDGDANVGNTSHRALSEQIKSYAQRGITLTTVGYGEGNYNDTMMERLANDGDGNYYYIDGEREARRVFVDKLTSTMEVIAKDVKIQVEWNPTAVSTYRLIGYENRDIADVDFRNDKVDAGEIGAGHQVTALYEVVLAKDAEGPLATVHIRNKAPGPEAPAAERTYHLYSNAMGASFAETPSSYRLSVAAAGFAELLRSSPHMSDVSYSEVHAVAKAAQRAEYDEDEELVRLIEQAQRLRH